MNKTIRNIIITSVSVLSIILILYGMSLNSNPEKYYTNPINTDSSYEKQEKCKNGKDVSVVEINYKIMDSESGKNYTLEEKHMQIMNLVIHDGNFVFVAENNGDFMLTPNAQGMIYFFVNKTYDFFDPIDTIAHNKILEKDYVFGDVLKIGTQGWMIPINLTKSNSDWIMTEPSPSDSYIGIKYKFSIPITLIVKNISNPTEDKNGIKSENKTMPVNKTVVYLKPVDCSKYSDVLKCIKDNYPQNFPPELKMNITSACPDGMVCPQYDEKDDLTSTSLTAGTNVCTVGFDCPKDTSVLTEATNCQSPCTPTSALTEATETQLLWAKIQDQNKKILENQNIMMCLEVVKNPDTWVQIGKYLTERGVNCTGLEIK